MYSKIYLKCFFHHQLIFIKCPTNNIPVSHYQWVIYQAHSHTYTNTLILCICKIFPQITLQNKTKQHDTFILNCKPSFGIISQIFSLVKKRKSLFLTHSFFLPLTVFFHLTQAGRTLPIWNIVLGCMNVISGYVTLRKFSNHKS